ncbi:MAG: SCO family protein [Planctomycetes bacterium]|nr:SCO family protein [Planctomycetota bacterium]
MMPNLILRPAHAALAVLGWACMVSPASAQYNGRQIEELDTVGITEHLGESLTQDLIVTNHEGNELRLGDLFDGSTPTILTLNYVDCPMLCDLQLTGLLKSMKELRWSAGHDYRVVTLSIDPEDTPKKLSAFRDRYLANYNRPGSDWTFLCAEQATIDAIANEVGFGYELVPDTGEFSHTAALFLLDGNGRLSRYLYGIEYDPQTLRLSLTESAAGEIQSSLDRLILYCFRYDAEKGRYAPAAWSMVQLGGALSVLFMLGFFSRLIRSNRKTSEESNA